MTQKIYYENPYQFEFKARIVSGLGVNSPAKVILNRTCFYPEGGGQPADRGWLNNIEVLDVQLQDGQIIHHLKSPIDVSEVTGKIDKTYRQDFMQQHTGQHILSQSLVRVAQIRTVSVHFGEEYTTIETDAPVIDESLLSEVENLANKVVNQNLPVRNYWIDPEDVEKTNIRRPPPEVEQIRIVDIDGFDAAACGGLHVAKTGEIGLIKIDRSEKIRGHIRIRAYIGQRAFRDYHRKSIILQELGEFLTCGEPFIFNRVRDLENQLKQTRSQMKKLQDEKMEVVAEKAFKQAEILNGVKYVSCRFDDVTNKQLKIFADHVLKNPDTVVAAVSTSGDKLYWMVAHSLTQELNLSDLVRPLLLIIEAKGGGSQTLVQGGGQKPSGIPDFFRRLKTVFEKEL